MAKPGSLYSLRFFWDCVKEAENEYELGVSNNQPEHEVMPTTLKVIFSDIEDRESVIEAIKQISPKFLINDTYTNYQEMLRTIHSSNAFIYFYGYFMLILNLLATLVYSIIYRKEVLSDEYYFNIRGFTNKDKKKICLSAFIYLANTVAFYGIIVLNLFISLDAKIFKLIEVHIFSKEYMILIISVILLSYLFPFLSELRLMAGDFNDSAQ